MYALQIHRFSHMALPLPLPSGFYTPQATRLTPVLPDLSVISMLSVKRISVIFGACLLPLCTVVGLVDVAFVNTMHALSRQTAITALLLLLCYYLSSTPLDCFVIPAALYTR